MRRRRLRMRRGFVSKIRTARAGDAADGEILAHQSGIIGIGIHAVPASRGALAHGVAEAPAVAEHAALVFPRGRRAVLRRTELRVACGVVGMQGIVAARLFQVLV